MWTWWNSTFTKWQQRTSITHIRGCRGDSNQYKTLQGINLATWHTSTMKATRVATFCDDYQRVEPSPSYPSAVFHAKTSMSSLWMALILSQCHPWSTVGCLPTQRPSKLLSFWDPINPVCASTKQSCSPGLDDRSTIDIGGSYHLRSSEYENRLLSIFPSGILHFPLVAHPVSHKATHSIANISHIEPPSWEGTLSRAAINHSSSIDSLFY
jgi:hypothetical protein